MITLTSKIKETIDLDKMSPEELKKVVKHLWHEVASLSFKVRMETGRNTSLTGAGITYLGDTALNAIQS